jgi:NADH-quinone oxidoreductase subunit J
LTNFVTLAVLYITLDAQFLAAAQVIIYAGGIVILILFVIMLIGSERIEKRDDHRLWSPYVGIALGIVMVVALIYSFASGFAGGSPTTMAVQGGVPEAVGMAMFTWYILPIELAGILLLVALLGALLLARQPESKPQD